MRTRILSILLLAVLIVCVLGSCGNDHEVSDMNEVAGKTYIWEKPGAGGRFTISLRADGTYQYYAGFWSSYIGMGNWTLKEGVVTLTETSGPDNVFRFAVEDGGLTFLAEGSSAFMYVDVQNRDRFLPADTASDDSSDPPSESKPSDSSDGSPAASYKQISQEEAKRMMEQHEDLIILDVRRQDEYDEGHVPGAICIPNESIGTEKPVELPNLDQIILVYCRSGRRSKEAAQKLFDIGYTNIYEFGGIIDWTGDIVKTNRDDNLSKTEPTPVLVIQIGEKTLYASLENNSSAEALVQKLNPIPLTLEMEDYGGFEKVGTLPWSLPRNDVQMTTAPGDIILYNGNRITIYYGVNSWNLTKLAVIGNASTEDLREILGFGDVTVSLSLEWSE